MITIKKTTIHDGRCLVCFEPSAKEIYFTSDLNGCEMTVRLCDKCIESLKDKLDTERKE